MIQIWDQRWFQVYKEVGIRVSAMWKLKVQTRVHYGCETNNIYINTYVIIKALI